MNSTTESPDALPSYDMKELVTYKPEDEPREIVCRVMALDRSGDELVYLVEDPLIGNLYRATFKELAPHIDFDLSVDDMFGDMEFGEVY